MYNEDIKNKYIEMINSNATLPKGCMEVLFKKTSTFEENMNKDCCNWTTTDIVNFYKYINTRSTDVLIVTNSRLSQYTQYCLDNMLVNDFQNHYKEINPDLLFTCINKNIFDKEIISKDEFDKYIDELDNPCDKFILLGLFEGIAGKDYEDIFYASINNIYKDDNNLYKIKLHCGKEIPISNQLANIAYESSETYSYFPLTKNGDRVIKLTGDSDRILKDKANGKNDVELTEFIKGRRIYTNVKRILLSLGLSKRITPKALYTSGMIWYLKKCCEENGDDVNDFLSNINKRKIIETKYKPIKNVKNFIMKYDKYL